MQSETGFPPYGRHHPAGIACGVFFCLDMAFFSVSTPLLPALPDRVRMHRRDAKEKKMENTTARKPAKEIVQSLLALASAVRQPEFRSGISQDDRRRYMREYPMLFPMTAK